MKEKKLQNQGFETEKAQLVTLSAKNTFSSSMFSTIGLHNKVWTAKKILNLQEVQQIKETARNIPFIEQT